MLKAAVIQTRTGIDRDENLAAVTDLIRSAAEAGAALISTPEMTTLLDQDAARLHASLQDEQATDEVAHFTALADELGAVLHIGSMPVRVETESASPRIANRAHVFAPGSGLVATYDKIHLFDVDLPSGEAWHESAKVAGGEEAVLVETSLAKIGLSICYDLRFAHLFRALAQAGAQILTIPAAFTRSTGAAHWEVLLRARAIETGSFVLAAAQGGVHADGRATYGHSMIIDPWGRILAEKPDEEPGFLLAELDLTALEDIRARLPSLSLDRPFRLRTYKQLSNTR